MDEKPHRLLGQYYTSRKTSGDIDVNNTSKVRRTRQVPPQILVRYVRVSASARERSAKPLSSSIKA